jgi:hypothetical protein
MSSVLELVPEPAAAMRATKIKKTVTKQPQWSFGGRRLVRRQRAQEQCVTAAEAYTRLLLHVILLLCIIRGFLSLSVFHLLSAGLQDDRK